MKIKIFHLFCSNCCLPWWCIWSQRAPLTNHSCQKYMAPLLTCYYGQSCTSCLLLMHIIEVVQEGIHWSPKINWVWKIYNIFYTNFSFPCLSSTFFPIFFVKNISLIVCFFFFTLLKICCIFQEGQFSWRENRIKVYCNKEPWEQGQSGLDYSFKLNLRKCWAFVFGKDWAFIL